MSLDLIVQKWFDWDLSAPTNNLSPTLTGQSISSSIGAITPQITYGVTGQSVTSTEGTLAQAVSYAIAGIAVASSEGAISASLAYSASGYAITSAEGVIAPELDYAISGFAGAFTEGNISASIGGNVTVTLAGQPVASTLGSITPELDYALAGETGAFSQGTLTAQVGADVTLTLAGISAQFGMGVIGITGADQAASIQTPAGRRVRFRNIYRVSVDGQKFEFRTLAEALDFLALAKAKAAEFAQAAVKTATDATPIKLKVPQIGISSRELRAAASQTKRDIREIYERAERDAEISFLMAIKAKEDQDDEDSLLLLM